MLSRTWSTIVTVTLNPTIDRVIEVPGFAIGGHQKGLLRMREPAGKAINVSRALAALGVANTAVGWVGMHTYDLFTDSLEKSGVRAAFIPITGQTRENITVIDSHARIETHIRDAGPTVGEADVRRLVDLLKTLAGPSTLVVFTGSLPPGLAISQWRELLETCIQRSAPVAVDTAGEPLRVASRYPLWMIKPNEAELAEMLRAGQLDEAALVAAGRDLASRIAVVMITAGAKGAYCFTATEALRGRTALDAGLVRSTVGCGDAVLAGFLAGLLIPGAELSLAFSEGLALAAASAMRDQPAGFDPADVQRLRSATSVSPVS